MDLLLYEFITGGGWYQVEADPPSGSLLAEGAAMLNAVAEDLLTSDSGRVTLLHDARLPPPQFADTPSLIVHSVASAAEHDSVLLDAGRRCDAALLIAPEFDQHLLRLTQRLEAADVKLLSPDSRFVELASDKHRTAERLAAAGVPVPSGRLYRSLDEFRASAEWHDFPAVLKPNQGAGSQGIRRFETLAQAQHCESAGEVDQWRCESLLSGRAASVAVLCGSTPLPCPACWQRVSAANDFTYEGGARILEAPLAQRAERLAVAAIAAMPPTHGYVGVDLILGEQADGSQDYVIEVNPRLTTSYVGLRHMTEENLAAAMLSLARGMPAQLWWNQRAIQFEAAGNWNA